MKNKIIPGFLILFTLIFIVCLFWVRVIDSAGATNIKDTLSNSQLSYFARIGAGVTINDTLVKIALTGNPSNTTNNLFIGDTIGIGNTAGGTTAPLTTYIIRDIGNTAWFEITAPLNTNNAFLTSAIVSTRSAIHTISFTPKSNVTGGAWQFLIKATSRTGEVWNDGIPDQQGFDFGQDVGTTTTGIGTRLKVADIACPFGSASVGTTAVIGSNSYNVITCDLDVGVTNPVDVGVSITVGRDLSTGSQLINPSAALNHTEGKADSSADTYTFFVRHLDGSDNVIDADTTSGKIAVIEAVRVTATVDPTLTFQIDASGLGVGATPCGNAAFGSNAANTTATEVKFGSLVLDDFNNLAQRLSCVTNGPFGYVVTAYEDAPMTAIGVTDTATGLGVTIPDTTCDGVACTTTIAAGWTGVDTGKSEFGYSLQSLTVGITTPFTAGVNFSAKPFGIGVANAKPVMSYGRTPTATHYANICYRMSITTTQQAANYENALVYTATATF